MDKKITWEDVVAAETGKIFIDKFEDGVRFIIMRDFCNLCAYIGVPEEHPLAGFEYDLLPISCHGGLTFAGTGENWPKGFYFYGWDYGHYGDYSVFDSMASFASGGQKWIPEDVEKDSWDAIYEFKKLAKLAESIQAKLLRAV